MASASIRPALVAAAAGLVALLAGCAAEPPPPPPPPPPPSVSLSPSLIDQASAYRLYMQRAAAISPAFSDGAQVASGVKVGASYEPQQLLKGAMAYGAIAALQDPTFVAALRGAAADRTQRYDLAHRIIANPSTVLGVGGAAGAAGLVVAAVGGDGRAVFTAGRNIKQAAYDVQHSAWSKADVADRPSRLSVVKGLSVTPLAGEAAETLRLQQAATGAGSMGLSADAVRPPYTPFVVRSLAVAALAGLGFGGADYLPQANAILAEPGTSACLTMSKLNLYQCLAVAKPHYEDVFCLGQHALMDTGRCLSRGVGAADAIEVYPQPLKVAGPVSPAPPASTPAKP
ncbi:MAG: hypothetical protein ABW042_08085 [Phenylobacterium sp.]